VTNPKTRNTLNFIAETLMPDLTHPLRVIIVDDEPLARARLKLLVQDMPQPRCVVLAECASAAEAEVQLQSASADCVLLDIQMPGTNGLDLAARLKTLSVNPSEGSSPAIIFVTAHDQHALKAFELEAADYLTKPVRRERLQAALARVLRQRQPALPVAAADVPVLVASERGRVARIPVHDVLYLKAELKYVTLRTAQRQWVLDESLTELENRLGDAHRFIRIHRNALVARPAVLSLAKHADVVGEEPVEAGAEAGWAVQVKHVDEWLAVSRRQLPAVRDALQEPSVSLLDHGSLARATPALT
jgi:two-component system, LytTR family, response regulator AlgR